MGSPAHNIYRDPERILRKVACEKISNIDCKQNFFRFVAFYNYFLRPASKGASLKGKLVDQDERIANDTYNMTRTYGSDIDKVCSSEGTGYLVAPDFNPASN